MSVLSPDERQALILSVGTHKKTRPDPPIQVARKVALLKKTMSLEQIANDLGLQETSTLQKFLALLKLPVEIQPLIVFGGMPGYLSFSVAYQIARLDDPKDIEMLVRDACENRRTKEEVRAIIQLYSRSKKDLASCIEEIDKTRPHVTRQYLFVGSFPQSIRDVGSYKEYSQKLRVALSKLVGADNVLSVAVNGGRFSFMLSEIGVSKPAVAPYLKPNTLENFVSELLAENNHA
jgi:hypothetical protein